MCDLKQFLQIHAITYVLHVCIIYILFNFLGGGDLSFANSESEDANRLSK